MIKSIKRSKLKKRFSVKKGGNNLLRGKELLDRIKGIKGPNLPPKSQYNLFNPPRPTVYESFSGKNKGPNNGKKPVSVITNTYNQKKINIGVKNNGSDKNNLLAKTALNANTSLKELGERSRPIKTPTINTILDSYPSYSNPQNKILTNRMRKYYDKYIHKNKPSIESNHTIKSIKGPNLPPKSQYNLFNPPRPTVYESFSANGIQPGSKGVSEKQRKNKYNQQSVNSVLFGAQNISSRNNHVLRESANNANKAINILSKKIEAVNDNPPGKNNKRGIKNLNWVKKRAQQREKTTIVPGEQVQ
jgi:hypothetical protein